MSYDYSLDASEPEAPTATRTDDQLSSPQARMTNIRAIAEDVCRRSGEDDDLLDALQLTFDKERLKKVIPRRIESRPSNEDPARKRYVFTQDYVNHLTGVMMLSCATLNDFLRAAGSQRTFSYGASKYYDGQTFEEVLQRDWPAQTIALSLEKRLLERIVTAHRAISLFMANADYVPARGMPRPVSPAFTDNSTFATRVVGTLSDKAPTVASPRQEDATWASEIEKEAQASYHQAPSEAPQEQPEASMSYTCQGKGKQRA